jgi:hypothetical protein
MLDGIDPNSPTWTLIAQWAEEEIGKCHAELEKDTDHAATNLVRGRIRALRSLLTLAKVPTFRPERKPLQYT